MIHVNAVKKSVKMFSEIKPGDLFIRSGEIYVLVKLEESVTNGMRWYNSASPNTGILMNVAGDELVILVEGATISI